MTPKSWHSFSALLMGLAVFLGGSMAVHSADLSLTDKGRSAFRIVLPEAPTLQEAQAAQELQQALSKISGAQMPVTRDASWDGPAIRIGRAAGAVCGVSDLNSLQPDEILMEGAGGQIRLAGQGPRGTLYAVYQFMEDQLGVRWWTEEDTYYPRRPTILLPEFRLRYAPPFESRELFGHDEHPAFLAHSRINGMWRQIPPELGGAVPVHGFCHTFFPLLPPDSYFAQHPEWYSMIDGKRVRDGQLCLTNPAMTQRLIEALKEILKAKPDLTYIALSQNDNERYCQCPECTRMAEQCGGQSGVLIDFLNRVGKAIAKDYPRVRIQTLAYAYTLEPPKLPMKLEPNIVVQVCVAGDFSKPMDSPANAIFAHTLQAWASIADKMSIWNYTANYGNYLIMNPYFEYLGRDLRFFKVSRAVSVLQLNDRGSGHVGDLWPLRFWLQAKLLWNPDLDQEALVKEFLEGYYGKGAPYVAEYLRTRYEAMHRHPSIRLPMAYLTMPWFEPQDALNWLQIFARGEAACAADPVARERLLDAKMALNWSILFLPELTPWGNNPGSPWRKAIPQELVEELLTETMARAHYREWKENIFFRELASGMQMRMHQPKLEEIPVRYRQLGAVSFKEYPKEYFRQDDTVKVIADPRDSHLAVGTLPPFAKEGSLQMQMPECTDAGHWKIYLEVRAGGIVQTAGVAMRAGVAEWNRPNTANDIPWQMLADQQWHLIEIADLAPNSAEYAWVDRVDHNPNSPVIFIRQFVMLRMKQ